MVMEMKHTPQTLIKRKSSIKTLNFINLNSKTNNNMGFLVEKIKEVAYMEMYKI